MATSDASPTVSGALDIDPETTEPRRPRKVRRRALLGGRLPLERLPNRVTGAPRQKCKPVDGQEILR